MENIRSYISFPQVQCVFCLAQNATIWRWIWYNFIVQNLFVYRCMNVYKNMFVYILDTFLKWPVFPSLTKILWIKIEERNRFPHQICVSHHRAHPITCVQQLPVIAWPWSVERFLYSRTRLTITRSMF